MSNLSYKSAIEIIERTKKGDIETFSGRISFIKYTQYYGISRELSRTSYIYKIQARVGVGASQGSYVILDDSLDVNLKRLDGSPVILIPKQKSEIVRILGDFEPLEIAGTELPTGFFGIFARSSIPGSGMSFPINLLPSLELIINGSLKCISYPP